MTPWTTKAAVAAGAGSAGSGGDGAVPTNGPGRRRYGRDVGSYSARNASKGALIAETHQVFRAVASGKSVADLRAACLGGELLRQSARETRNRIWDALYFRFFAWGPPTWIIRDLAAASQGEATSPAFVGLVMLHCARRDHLTFDFVTERLWSIWRRGGSEVRRSDVLDFLAEARDEQPSRWRETTRTKLAGNVLSALRDFGLLRGVQRKTLQRPVVPPEVALHLCRLLYAEGLRGRSLLEAADWRLFLWNIDDTARSLNQIAQSGAIHFERSGRTVVLEIPNVGGETS